MDEEEIETKKNEMIEMFDGKLKDIGQRSSRYGMLPLLKIHASHLNQLLEEELIMLCEYKAVSVQYFEKEEKHIKATPKRKYLDDYLQKYQPDFFEKYALLLKKE